MTVIACHRHSDLAWAHAQVCVRLGASILARLRNHIVLEKCLDLIDAENNAAPLLASYQSMVAGLAAGPEKVEILELFDHCHSIATWSQPGSPPEPRRLLKGAFLEAFIFGLLTAPGRADALHEESRLRYDAFETPCLDVVAVHHAGPLDFEGIECKWYPPDLGQSYIDRVDGSRETIREHGHVIEFTVATVASRKFVNLVFAGRVFPDHIRCATLESLLALRRGRAPHSLDDVANGRAA